MITPAHFFSNDFCNAVDRAMSICHRGCVDNGADVLAFARLEDVKRAIRVDCPNGVIGDGRKMSTVPGREVNNGIYSVDCRLTITGCPCVAAREFSPFRDVSRS
jgi:hypothetical protein